MGDRRPDPAGLARWFGGKWLSEARNPQFAR